MKQLFFILSLLYSLESYSQGAVVLKRNDYFYEGEWFCVKGLFNQGLFMFVGNNKLVQKELKRLAEYYNIDEDSYEKDSYNWIRYEFETDNGRTVVIEVTEMDITNMTKTIYLKVFK